VARFFSNYVRVATTAIIIQHFRLYKQNKE
jgi:hypothetical protein